MHPCRHKTSPHAIVAGINAGGEQFLEGTLAAALPIIWIVILGLHLGRPYILDMIDRFTLRLGADLLWLVYVGLRDLLIVSGVVMSFMFFFPDVVVTDALPTHRRVGGGVPLRRAADQADGRSGPQSAARIARSPHCWDSARSSTSCPTCWACRRIRWPPTNWGPSASSWSPTRILIWAVGLAYVSIALLAIMGAIAVVYVLWTGGRPEVSADAAATPQP